MADNTGSTKGASLFIDGELEEAEALGALAKAAERATEALPDALARCDSDEERQRVMAERDVIVLAYLSSIKKSLIHTAPKFEKLADDLEREADRVRQKAKALKNAVDAINLFSELTKLAASVALAFA
jgi:hypothetical protein